MDSIWVELKTVLIISVLLLTPGWAFLLVSGLWQRWYGLQRWFMAIGISIAFYPVLYYLMRTLLPTIRLGRNKLIIMLAAMTLLILWCLRKKATRNLKMGKWGWVALLVLAITLFTRFWLAHLYPYPAWTDSLHHSILTHLTASSGQIPTTFLPYDVTSTGVYHLGLYALSGPLEILANIPGHTAVLWMGQALNGLCGIGVFLFLDRKVGRIGAIAGMIVAGLVSIMPAYYFNWGRYTQVGSQAILLIAAFATWETIRAWRVEWPVNKGSLILLTLMASLLNASVFLIHFQVAGYAFPLLAIIATSELIKAIGEKKGVLITLIAILVIILISLIFILPALLPAFEVYYSLRSTALPDDVNGLTNIYYFNLKGLYEQTGKPWFLILALVGIIVGLIKKPRETTIIAFSWLFLLAVEGFSYLLNIPLLAFTNMSGILIMLYLPIGLFIGIMTQKVIGWVPKLFLRFAEPVILVLLIGAGMWGAFGRVNEVENFRQFMTPDDEVAMAWIAANTPENAVFAVNTEFWLPSNPTGTDAGYWIPYFTGRRTNTGLMLSGFGEAKGQLIERSKAVMRIYEDPAMVENLCSLGVNYVFTGEKEPYNGRGFDIDALITLPNVKLLYQAGGVGVLEICN